MRIATNPVGHLFDREMAKTENFRLNMTPDFLDSTERCSKTLFFVESCKYFKLKNICLGCMYSHEIIRYKIEWVIVLILTVIYVIKS